MNTQIRHIFLTGMMGSGKSVVGKKLAELLDYDLIDLDKEIENIAGISIENIFLIQGQAEFRELETQVAYGLDLNNSMVVSTGGGFPLKEENREWMKNNGIIVWLKCSAPVIFNRIKDENRPLLPKPIKIDHIESILESRVSIYEQADLVIDTDNKLPDVIALKIKENIT